MSKQGGLQQNFYIGGFSISGDVGAINNASSPRSVQEATGIDKSAIERIMTLADGQCEWANWFDDATGAVHDALSGLPTADVSALWALGTSIGDPCYMIQGKQINYDWARNQDGSMQGTTQVQSDGVAPEWGEMLTAGLRTDSGAASGDSLNNGAATASGLAAMLHVTAFTGTSVTVVIEESSDDGAADAFTTVASFTAVTGANATERITATGAVEQYLRVTTSGTFTTAIFAVGVRRGDSNDDESY